MCACVPMTLMSKECCNTQYDCLFGDITPDVILSLCVTVVMWAKLGIAMSHLAQLILKLTMIHLTLVLEYCVCAK